MSLARTAWRATIFILAGFAVAHCAANDQKGSPNLNSVQPSIWSLHKGERYWRINGIQTFVLGRNPSEKTVGDFDRRFGEAETNGERLVRIHLMHGMPARTTAGQIDSEWVARWDRVFDAAARHGIAVIPVFSIWAEWNDGSNKELWHVWNWNPYNVANGGPAASPSELLRDTPCRRMWIAWLTRLVQRWQSRSNIAAWEVFSELDLVTGSQPASAAEFVARASAAVRTSDKRKRPITVSLSGIVDWPEVYGSACIDIVQVHPYGEHPRYAGNLADMILDCVGDRLRRYGKPVLVGECGLDSRRPGGTLTEAQRAQIGIGQAIWAQAVSGAANGRMLWWEDGYDKYEDADLAGRYRDAAAPVARFVRGVDFADIRPAPAHFSAELHGAALAGTRHVLAWFRDSRCGPPNWPMRNVDSEIVSIEVSGGDGKWRVRFFDTSTGDRAGSKSFVTDHGRLVVPLPSFRGSIAFIAAAETRLQSTRQVRLRKR